MEEVAGLRRAQHRRRWARAPLAWKARSLKKTGLEDFFADVEQYYLQTLYQLSDKKVCKEYLEEAGSWRTATRPIPKNVSDTRH